MPIISNVSRSASTEVTSSHEVDKATLEFRAPSEPKLSVKQALKVLVPVGLGVYGGLATGRWAGLAAAAAATPALVMGGVVAGSFISQDLFGQSDAKQAASAGIGAGIGLGLGVGAYCLAKSQSNVGLAITLGLAGAASALMGKFLKS